MKVAIENFTQISPLVVEMFHEKETTEGRTDVETDVKHLIGCGK
jgi:hydroxylamine reductase (hybrid-cluster protein)